MRPSRFTEQQILQALRQVRGGTSAVEMCRKLGVTETTFYRWRKKFDGEPRDADDVRALRDENAELKGIVADLLLDRQRLMALRAKR
jgi:putative transposase